MTRRQWTELHSILAEVRTAHAVTPEVGERLTALLATMSTRDQRDFHAALRDAVAASQVKR